MIAAGGRWAQQGRMSAMPLTRGYASDSSLAAFATVIESAHREDGGGPSTVDWPRIALELAPDVDAAAHAREALEQLDGHLEEQVLEDMRLLVTELVTNSVRHSDAAPGDPVRLEVSVHDDRVRVLVEDGGSGFRPRARTPDSPDDGGWGLHLVEQVSDRWGVSGGGRTRVWLELARARPSHAP